MTTVNPYLIFNGNCEEAFNFYKSVFGGEFPYMGRYKEMECGEPVPENDAEKIMHVSLPIGEGTILMGGDCPESRGPLSQGENFHVAIGVDNVEEAKRLFDGLSEGGKIIMPLEKTFFAKAFGMFDDKFGVCWMVNCD